MSVYMIKRHTGAEPRRDAHDADRVPSLAGIGVLVVEDDADSRDVVVEALERAGASVRAVADARAALESLVEQTATVVVCDIGMDGLSFIEQLRSLPVAKPITRRRYSYPAVSSVTTGTDDASWLSAHNQNAIAKWRNRRSFVRRQNFRKWGAAAA